jgi:SulP family sulfate permease
MSKEEKVTKKEGRWPLPFAGLRGLKPADLSREIPAGITLAALIIPLNIGYAQVAGLPPTAGLYAAIIPLLIFALFTSSRHVVGSPDASIAALVGATLLVFASPGDPQRMQYAVALALLCGLVFFTFWFFRLAFLANFLSKAIMVGFITGLGIEVFTNQVRRMMGAAHPHGAAITAWAEGLKDSMATSVDTKGYLVEVIALFESIPHANLYSVAIGLGALFTVRLMKRYAPKIPGALVALLLTTLAVAFFKLDQKGVSVLGAIPSGLPSFTLPGIPAADYLKLLPGAFAVVAITMCEGLLLVRRYSRRHGYKADGNQVLFAYGVANVAAGFTGSLITGNSPSRSAAMESSGSRSQLPSLVAAVTIAVVMLFFTDMLAYLPNAALAGIVANAVLSLIEVGELRELWRIRRSDFWIALVCLLSVLVLGPLQAVIIAFLLATIDVVRRASKPGTWVLREAEDGSHLVPVEPGDAPDSSGLLVYRFGSSLYFANANLFMEEIEKLIVESPTPIRSFILDAEAIVDLDATGAEVFREVLSLMSKHGVTFALSRANKPLVQLLANYHLLDMIGENRLYPTNRHAVAALRSGQSKQ